jgi:hypothetical protein
MLVGVLPGYWSHDFCFEKLKASGRNFKNCMIGPMLRFGEAKKLARGFGIEVLKVNPDFAMRNQGC